MGDGKAVVPSSLGVLAGNEYQISWMRRDVDDGNAARDSWDGWWQDESFGWHEPEQLPSDDPGGLNPAGDIQGLADMRCHVCGGLGHMARSCPTPNLKGGGKGGKAAGKGGAKGRTKGDAKGRRQRWKEESPILFYLW